MRFKVFLISIIAVALVVAGYYVFVFKPRDETAKTLMQTCLNTFDLSLTVTSDQFFMTHLKDDGPAIGIWACVKAADSYRMTGEWKFE